MKGYLLLEDGHLFTGQSIGSQKEVICEIVFNTSMSGYVELLTDPSYAGQGVVMTYPLIGNYGVCFEGLESKQPWVSAFLMRELSRIPSNFRSEGSLEDYLVEAGIPGLQGIDTRALTKLLREKGTMNGMITTDQSFNREEALKRIAAYKKEGLVQRASCRSVEHYGENGAYRVALLDLGGKASLVKCLTKRGCQVTAYPCGTPAEAILAGKPDGIVLSGGPGDPKDCGPIIGEVGKLMRSGAPLFAVGLGHQAAALAAGCDTNKLPYGHRGSNHPVRDTATGRTYISAQGHGYAVDGASLPEGVHVSFVNVNDGSVEGLSFDNLPVFTTQFHPEPLAGPCDTQFLLDRFVEHMGGGKHA